MSKYDEKLVDELLNLVEQCKATSIANNPVFNVLVRYAEDLKPKPAKFYVIPEWDGLANGPIQKHTWSVLVSRAATLFEDKALWDAIREATATDKPMVHIPSGKDWCDENIATLRYCFTENEIPKLIDSIKAMLEPKP